MRLFILFSLIMIFSLTKSQDSLSLIDNSKQKRINEISWGYSDLLDLNIALKYERQFSKKVSFAYGGSLRLGSSSLTNITIAESFVMNTIYIVSHEENKSEFISYSKIVNAQWGYEVWTGVSFYPKEDRSRYYLVSMGYNYIETKDNTFSHAGFVGINLGFRVIDKPKYFIDVQFVNKLYVYDFNHEGGFSLSTGFLSHIGYKF